MFRQYARLICAALAALISAGRRNAVSANQRFLLPGEVRIKLNQYHGS